MLFREKERELERLKEKLTHTFKVEELYNLSVQIDSLKEFLQKEAKEYGFRKNTSWWKRFIPDSLMDTIG